MTAMGVIPWGDSPLIEWDSCNVEHVADHRVTPWEVDEMIIAGEMTCVRHPKWRKSKQHARRYLLRGRTLGGRRLLVVIEHKKGRHIRPITAWDDL